jgi:hypothetical protein
MFNKAVFTQPTIYVGLGKSNGDEITGGGYARIATTSADWSTPTALAVTNNNPFAFAVPAGNWGIANEVQLWDAVSGGNQLAANELTEQQNLIAGLEDIIVPAGSVTFTAVGALEDEWLEAMLNHLFGHAVMDQLDQVWLALQDDAGNEPTGSGTNYERVQLKPADWNSAVGSAISNANNLVFNQPTSNWGIIYVARLYRYSEIGESWQESIFNSAYGGELIATAWFTDPRDVAAVDPGPEFLAGLLRVRLV